MGTECVCAQVFSLCAMRVRFLPHGQVRRGAGLDETELGVFWVFLWVNIGGKSAEGI